MHKLKQLIDQLNKMGIQPFIGYGNPDADILIVGKECALKEESVDWTKFYVHNFHQWEMSFSGHGFGYWSKKDNEPYSFEYGNFHPIYPFYQQAHTLKKGRNGTSRTYFYYQRLIDRIRGDESHPYIDFFEHCFITELNERCRPNNNNLQPSQHKETESSIRARFNWMRHTNFFNQFKIVILACGPYANAIKKDEILRKDLFGNAQVYYCNQLSRWDKRLDEEIIPDIIKWTKKEISSSISRKTGASGSMCALKRKRCG